MYTNSTKILYVLTKIKNKSKLTKEHKFYIFLGYGKAVDLLIFYGGYYSQLYNF